MLRIAPAILLSLVTLCGSCENTKQTSQGPAPQSPAAAPVSDPVFAVPVGTTPAYRILDGKSEQEGYARYLRARIMVPPGLDAATLEANIRHAAKTLYERDHPTGMFVFAYKEGTDVNGIYTAGRCDFHPVSKDKHDPTVTLKDCRAEIDLQDSYFQAVVSKPEGTDDDVWKAVHQKLREQQRKAIYYEIGTAGNKATAEAAKRYPDTSGIRGQAFIDRVGKRNQLEEDLTKRYETAAGKKHQLTYAEVQAIKSEGDLANWPLPPSK
jgi:hypothetical protein